jgi:hypothetical protein
MRTAGGQKITGIPYLTALHNDAVARVDIMRKVANSGSSDLVIQ